MAPKQKGKMRKSGNGSKKAAPISHNKRAGTIFPVGRLNRMIKQGRYSERVGASARAYMAAVLEYITAELVELAGNLCEEAGKKLITPKHLNLGIRHDDELSKLMTYTTISQGGMMQNIHDFLMPEKKGAKKTSDSQAV